MTSIQLKWLVLTNTSSTQCLIDPLLVLYQEMSYAENDSLYLDELHRKIIGLFQVMLNHVGKHNAYPISLD